VALVTVAALATRIRAGEVSPREAVEASLARIEACDGTINAFISVRAEEALAEADAAERTVAKGLLHGVPVAVKDVIDVAGTVTSAGSRILADRVAVADAEVVVRLRAAGAIVLGKLNTHEFAFGATTTSPHFGPAHNPWDTSRICGGSSGGSGAAVAARLVPGALGTDTGGSVRIPAALCGVTGVRPSTGRVSNRGVVPVSWTFDAVGPLACTAEDCALLLRVIAGHDPADPSTVTAPVPPYAEQLEPALRGVRVGVVSHLLDDAVDPRVATAVESAVGELGTLGARVERVDASFLRETEVVQQLIMLPEAAAVHLPWLRSHLPDYGADVRVRLLAGLLLPGTAVVTGQRARGRLYDQAAALFERFDLLVAPEMPIVAPLIGEDTVSVGGARVPYRLALIPFNSPWSCLGLPVASVPCGFVDGLPVGLALVGRRLGEAAVLGAAHAFQLATDWHERTPPDLA
jgi:aspartyl-tRNA(Asn)/glutamyl-tRNA(Gln) amidotransferase subunit A